MESIKSRNKFGLFLLASIFTFSLVIVSVDYSSWTIWEIGSFLILGFLLTQWYITLGLISPVLREKVWSENHGSYDIPTNEQHDGIFSIPIRIVVPLIISIFTLYVKYLHAGSISKTTLVVIILYVLVPTILLHFRYFIILPLVVMWGWFPIEWGYIQGLLEPLELVILPIDALLGIFSLMWGLIVTGRHIPWYGWELSKDDLKIVAKSSVYVSLSIIPLGIVLNFLTINPSNFLNPEVINNPLLNAFLIFSAIFVVQGLMEELLFRDIIFKHWYYYLEQIEEKRVKPSGIDYGKASIIGSGVIVASIPVWDDILIFLTERFNSSFIESISNQVGSLDLPLGVYEGKKIAIIENYPNLLFYLLVAIFLVIVGLRYYKANSSPFIAALIASSIIFGFAHFEDWRYVLFATFAGIGYGYTYFKTKNLVAAAALHMGVDAVWALFLQY